MTDPDRRRIPMLDLQGEVEELWDEITAAIHRVLRSGQFILGPEVEAFEKEAAAYLGAKHAVGLNSGTDALIIGLRALGIGPGDEVITTAFSFFATAEAIVHVGATPVFVDIRLDSFNLDPALIEGAITERTRAILPVHLYGNPAAMATVMELAGRYGLKVLEDCAQSFGARYYGAAGEDEPAAALVGKMTGTIGDAGAFSFYPTKSLGAYGDGGMLVTDDDGVALSARKLRNHGALSRYDNEMLGYNSRLDALQAAVLRVKLPYVDVWRARRLDHVRRYESRLSACGQVVLPQVDRGHIAHQYSILLAPTLRGSLLDALGGVGIETAIYYPRTLDDLIGSATGVTAPNAQHASQSIVSLPIGACLGPHVVESVSEHIVANLKC